MPQFQDSAVVSNAVPNMKEVIANADDGATKSVEVPLEDVTPSNVHTLSTGVRVQFNGPLLETMMQSILTHTFVDANLDEEGKVREDTGDADQNIAQAAAMLRYNGALLSALNGDYEPVVTLYDGLPDDSGKKLGALRRNPLVAAKFPHINWSDGTDREFMFLNYFAFKTAEDWALLSSELLGSRE